jgi:hypothetical protein
MDASELNQSASNVQKINTLFMSHPSFSRLNLKQQTPSATIRMVTKGVE